MGWRLYADDPWRRVRQVAGDLAVLVAAWAVGRLAASLRTRIGELDAVAERLDGSGRAVVGAADRAGAAVDGVPLVGDALAGPFRSLGGAGDELVDAGARFGDVVATAAVWLPAALVVIVLGYLVLRSLPARVRWIREATEVARLLDSPGAAQLLAVRAVATRPLRALRREVGDPAAAYATGDHVALARVELRALGLSAARLDGAATDRG